MRSSIRLATREKSLNSFQHGVQGFLQSRSHPTFFFLPSLSLCCFAWTFSQLQQAVATLRFSAQASHCHGFLLWSTGSRHEGFNGAEGRLGSCGSRAQLPCVWSLPLWPGIKLMSLALAGRFLSTGPPGNTLLLLFQPDVSFSLHMLTVLSIQNSLTLPR